jgi:hypothetical protein
MKYYAYKSIDMLKRDFLDIGMDGYVELCKDLCRVIWTPTRTPGPPAYPLRPIELHTHPIRVKWALTDCLR